MTLIRIAASVIFVVSVPLAISLTNLRAMALDPNTYQRGFQRYGAEASTGMSPAELETAAAQLIAYFNSGEPITLQITKSGQTGPLFNEREMAHLLDVKDLFQLGFRVQTASVAFVIIFVVTSLTLGGWRGVRLVAALLTWGGGLTVALLLAASAGALFDFDNLFLQFHLLSFSNDLWILDPRTDYMIRLFPQGFWLEATMTLALRSMAVGIGTALLGLLGLVVTAQRTAQTGRMGRSWLR